MKKIFHTVTMAALLVAATSCEHKELCLDHAHAVEGQLINLGGSRVQSQRV